MNNNDDQIDTIEPVMEGQEQTIKEEPKENLIDVSPDVIAKITGVAVSEIPGVSGMSGGLTSGVSELFSGKKNLSKGIKVEMNGDKATIDVNIVVDYGTRIPDIAYEIQTKVKDAVEKMTGIKVAQINVHVTGINTNVDQMQTDEIEAIERKSEENENY